MTSILQENNRSLNRSLIASLASGTFQTVLFNPWDKANYLAIKHRRSFLDKRNFVHPFQGVTNNAFGRFISCGLYFTFLDRYKHFFASKTKSAFLSSLCSGMATGTTVAVLTNAHSVVKYSMWGKKDASFLPQMIDMYKKGGAGVFSRGLKSRIGRDIIFSIVFSTAHDFTTIRFDGDAT